MIIYFLDIFGTFAFAVSGAFRAVKYELDLLGVIVLSVATGIGGGLIRDVLLGSLPPYALCDEIFLVVCLAGALLVFFAAPGVAQHWNSVMLADAVGLSVFAAIGAAKAEELGAGAINVVMMATMTATGGGIVRDVLIRQVPEVLKSGFYASAALIGGVFFVFLNLFIEARAPKLFAVMALTLCLRVLAIKYGLSLPRMKRLPAGLSKRSIGNRRK